MGRTCKCHLCINMRLCHVRIYPSDDFKSIIFISFMLINTLDHNIL